MLKELTSKEISAVSGGCCRPIRRRRPNCWTPKPPGGGGYTPKPPSIGYGS